MNNKKLSKLLTFVLIMLAIIGAVLFFIAIPSFGKWLAESNSEYKHAYIPWLILTWTMAAAYFFVLYQGHIIFREIGRDNPFSEINSKALTRIAYASAAESVIFGTGNIIYMAFNMSSPGVFLIAMGFCALGVTLAVFASSLSQLVVKAEELKEANDLTI
ncbi:MAG: DUF2975 domain-containing protein [Clostridiaceae bacterium]